MNNYIKISLLFIVLLFVSCDFRVPQEWETPEWQFDLNIPLINDEYLMSSIASNTNDIQITHPDSLDFIVSINERIIDEGLIVTDESFFIIDESNLEFSLEDIIEVPNPNPMPEIPNISETVNMQNLFNNIDQMINLFSLFLILFAKKKRPRCFRSANCKCQIIANSQVLKHTWTL